MVKEGIFGRVRRGEGEEGEGEEGEGDFFK